MLKKIYFLLVLLAFSSVSFSKEKSPPSPPLLDHDKLYLEMVLGKADQDTEYEQYSVSGDSFSVSLRSGYSFNEYVAVELGYTALGKSESERIADTGHTLTSEISPSSLDVGIKGVLPITEQFFVNARVGVANWRYDLEIVDEQDPDNKVTGGDSGRDVYYGGGIFYKPNDTFYLGFEYTVYEFDIVAQESKASHSINNIGLLFGAKL